MAKKQTRKLYKRNGITHIAYAGRCWTHPDLEMMRSEHRMKRVVLLSEPYTPDGEKGEVIDVAAPVGGFFSSATISLKPSPVLNGEEPRQADSAKTDGSKSSRYRGRLGTMGDVELDLLERLIRKISSREDMEIVSGMIQAQWAVIRQEAATSLRCGDRVSFDDGRGNKIHGTVKKVNRVNVKITADDGFNWTVAGTLLERE